MCYAIPGRVVKIEGGIATIDYFGEEKKARCDVVNVDLGDYVYAQGGIIIQRIPEGKAKTILDIWEGRFFELKNIDAEIDKDWDLIELNDEELREIFLKTSQKTNLNKSDIIRLLKIKDKKILSSLFVRANHIRKEEIKNSCCVHGIIEFSNHCRNDCFYCGIRCANKDLARYRMSVNEIVEAAIFATKQLGFKALVLQSGEDVWYTTEKLCQIIKGIKEKCDVIIFMSIGGRSLDCYKKMYKTGARGVLLRFETSNPILYQEAHRGPKANVKKRLELLMSLKKIGYIIATGFLIGLPNQKPDDLANDILMVNSLNPEMWSFGPLNPHPQTPFADQRPIDIESALKVIAISRLVNPQANILVTTALETIDRTEGARRGLLSGANSLMINVTPDRYKNLYSIYPGKSEPHISVRKEISDKLKLLQSLGRAPTDLGI